MRTIVKLAISSSMLVLLVRCSSSTSPSTSSGTDAGTYDAGGTVASNDSGASGSDAAATGTDAGAADTGTDAGCQLPANLTTNATCNTCLQTYCCGAVLACYQDTECLNLNNCLATCQQGQAPNDGGTFDASDEGEGGPLGTCESTCLVGVAASVVNELSAQLACTNPSADGGTGSCETACQ